MEGDAGNECNDQQKPQVTQKLTLVGVWNTNRVADKIPQKEEGCIRFVCMSDSHMHHRKHRLPAGDIFVHAGDFTNYGGIEEVDEFAAFLEGLDFKHKVVIAGNHDVSFDAERAGAIFQGDESPTAVVEKLKTKCTYLQNEVTTVEEIRIFGSPYSVGMGAFGVPRNSKRAELLWQQIPDDIHILLTHGPPSGAGVSTSRIAIEVGDEMLKEAVLKKQPLLHLCGHIHEGYGVGKLEATTVINCAVVDYNHPVVFDVKFV